jgi:hypothetical protein
VPQPTGDRSYSLGLAIYKAAPTGFASPVVVPQTGKLKIRQPQPHSWLTWPILNDSMGTSMILKEALM